MRHKEWKLLIWLFLKVQMKVDKISETKRDIGEDLIK